MNIGDALEKLTVNKEIINEYYKGENTNAEFLVKSTDVFTEDVVNILILKYTLANRWASLKRKMTSR